MSRGSDHQELFRLLFDLVEDQLTDEGAERLEQLLKSEAEYREIYADFMLEVSGLHRLCASRATALPRGATHELSVREAPTFLLRGISTISTPAGFGAFFAAVTMISLMLFFAQIHVSNFRVSSSPTAQGKSSAPIAGRLLSEIGRAHV